MTVTPSEVGAGRHAENAESSSAVVPRARAEIDQALLSGHLDIPTQSRWMPHIVEILEPYRERWNVGAWGSREELDRTDKPVLMKFSPKEGRS